MNNIALSQNDVKMLRAAWRKAAEFSRLEESVQHEICAATMQGMAAVLGLTLHYSETSAKADMIRRLDAWIINANAQQQ